VKYIEAEKILAKANNGSPLAFLLGMSGTSDQLTLFLRAIAAVGGKNANIEILPFGTLAQALHSPAETPNPEIFVLMPWDFVQECDWRSGFPKNSQSIKLLIQKANGIAELIKQRSNAKILYLPAPIPPIMSGHQDNKVLSLEIAHIAQSLGAHLLDSNCFNLAGYLVSGNPLNSTQISDIAQIAINMVTKNYKPSAKVLVTDLDGVLWSGVVAEDGIDGIFYGPEGRGFPHYLYQSFVGKLKEQGVLIAAVSRNDKAVASLPFEKNKMLISKKHFVAFVANYETKSSNISALGEQLNLGLDSFVFVDDNSIEIAEVSSALPEVKCLQFPSEKDLPYFFDELSNLFSKREFSEEDRNRTELYRVRANSIPNSSIKPVDLETFLSQLNMTLEVKNQTADSMSRAVQLINKTNQFNINGKRVTNDDVVSVIESGGNLFTGTLSDNTGSHGEVLVCLIDSSGCIVSLVMSCRIFQRRAEYAFLCWVLKKCNQSVKIDFSPTERNLPIRNFLEDAAFTSSEDGKISVNSKLFTSNHRVDLDLFNLVEIDY